MTITEQLQFSVLTAPLARVDRRTLSQAWYSALYASGKNGTAQKQHPAQLAPILQVPGAHDAPAVQPRDFDRAPATHARSVKNLVQVQAEGIPRDRRAPRSPLARRIERVFLRRPHVSGKASFTIEGEGGRVHVLLRTHGGKLELIAICAPKARANVAAALSQARYALAMRGIHLDAHARTHVPC